MKISGNWRNIYDKWINDVLCIIFRKDILLYFFYFQKIVIFILFFQFINFRCRKFGEKLLCFVEFVYFFRQNCYLILILLRDFLVFVKCNICMMNVCCFFVYGILLGVVNLFSFDEKCKCMLYLKIGMYIYNLFCKQLVYIFLML